MRRRCHCGPIPPDESELLQGTLDVLVLRVLSQGATHGYAIARFIRERSGRARLAEIDVPIAQRRRRAVWWEGVTQDLRYAHS